MVETLEQPGQVGGPQCDRDLGIVKMVGTDVAYADERGDLAGGGKDELGQATGRSGGDCRRVETALLANETGEQFGLDGEPLGLLSDLVPVGVGIE